jgi:tRNA/tmRNA/rRNA uracil-C5-methylase (TrmA/RlmC/RlmD family)
MNRTNFRPRQLDYSKPIQLVSDINEVFKKDDLILSTFGMGNSYEDKRSVTEIEIKRVMDLFDKKKTIVIPKVEKLDKNPNAAAPTGEGNFSIDLNYKQKLYERPKHCIVYSQKNVLEPQGKDYEATIHDMNFLKYENTITLEELEKIVSELENDINKGEMIPQDRIREIILRIIPDKKGFVDKIAKVSLLTTSNYIIIVF